MPITRTAGLEAEVEERPGHLGWRRRLGLAVADDPVDVADVDDRRQTGQVVPHEVRDLGRRDLQRRAEGEHLADPARHRGAQRGEHRAARLGEEQPVDRVTDRDDLRDAAASDDREGRSRATGAVVADVADDVDRVAELDLLGRVGLLEGDAGAEGGGEDAPEAGTEPAELEGAGGVGSRPSALSRPGREGDEVPGDGGVRRSHPRARGRADDLGPADRRDP